MPDNMKTDFFADLQNTKRTTIGEILHPFIKTRKIMALISASMTKYDTKKIWKKEPARKRQLAIFACMAYHCLKAPESTKDVSNDALQLWVDKEGNTVDQNAYNVFEGRVFATLDGMHKMGNIPYAGTKNMVLCFFFLVNRETPIDICDKIIAKYKKTKDLEFPNVIGTQDQAYRRYMHLVTTYVENYV